MDAIVILISPERRVDLVVGIVLAALSMLLVLRLGAGVDVAVGPDAPLWVASAFDWRAGLPTVVPPGFGALVATLAGATSPLADMARHVSVGAVGVAVAATWFAARSMDVGRPAALAGALLVALHPDTTSLGLMVQPDMVTAAWFSLLAWAMVRHSRVRSIGSAAAVVGATTMLVVTREHGLVVAPCVGLYLAACPIGARFGRAASLTLLGVGLLVGGAYFRGGPLVPPWSWPWAEKGLVPLQDLRRIVAGEEPTFVAVGVDAASDAGQLPGFDAAYREALTRPRSARLVRVLQLDLARAWALGWDLYGCALAAIVGAIGYARRAGQKGAAVALIGLLLTCVPTLVIWSARRHVAVLLPVMAVGAAMGLDVATAWLRGWAAQWVGVGLIAAAAWRAGTDARERGIAWLLDRARIVRPWAEFGRRIRDATPPGALLAGVPHGDLVHLGGTLQVYSERAWAPPDTSIDPARGSLAWHTVRLDVLGNPRPPGPDWKLIASRDTLRAWWLSPAIRGATRACFGGVLDRHVYFFTPRRRDPLPAPTMPAGCGPAP